MHVTINVRGRLGTIGPTVVDGQFDRGRDENEACPPRGLWLEGPVPSELLAPATGAAFSFVSRNASLIGVLSTTGI